MKNGGTGSEFNLANQNFNIHKLGSFAKLAC